MEDDEIAPIELTVRASEATTSQESKNEKKVETEKPGDDTDATAEEG